MPTKVFESYIRFHESVHTRNTIAGGLGKAHYKKCGIPQGCPLSLCLTSVLVRPWVCKMEDMGVQARILADDMLIIARGQLHGSRIKRALDETHRYLVLILVQKLLLFLQQNFLKN